MNTAPDGDQAPADLKAALAALSRIQMLQAGLGFSIVAFGAIVLYLTRTGFSGTQEQPSSDLMLGVLSLVNVVLTCLLYVLAYALPRRILLRRIRRLVQTMENDQGQDPNPVHVSAFVSAFAYTRFLRLLMLDFPGCFGLWICLVSAMIGAVDGYPQAWLNAMPAGVFLAYAVVSFPTRDRVLDAFRRRVELARHLDEAGACS